MPSFGDTALIALLALLLFGPKKLPELARQLGKLMGDFRRASNEFRMQMEDELRISEQAENQKKIAAMEAAAPVAPPLYQDESLVLEHPHMHPAENSVATLENTIAQPAAAAADASTDAAANAAMPERHTVVEPAAAEPSAGPAEPLPIATSGALAMMPPSTGLPASRSPLSSVFDAIPHTPDPGTSNHSAEAMTQTGAQLTAEESPREASLHG